MLCILSKQLCHVDDEGFFSLVLNGLCRLLLFLFDSSIDRDVSFINFKIIMSYFHCWGY